MGGASKCKFHISYVVHTTVDISTQFFQLLAAAFLAQPQSISPAFTQVSHWPKTWTDFGGSSPLQFFCFWDFPFKFPAALHCQTLSSDTSAATQAGHELRNVFRQKKQHICTSYSSAFLSFEDRLHAGFCQLFLLGPLESPLCMCNLVVIQRFGLSLSKFWFHPLYHSLFQDFCS